MAHGKIEMLAPDRIMKYRVTVYRNGAKIGDSPTETRWGARRVARRMKRRALATTFSERRTL